MSIRLRLTLLYSTILVLTLIVFSMVLYVTLAQSTLSVVKATLADEAARLLSDKQVNFRLLPSGESVISVQLPHNKFASENTFIQARDLRGDVRYRTPNLQDLQLPISDTSLNKVRGGHSQFSYTSVEGERLLIYNKPVRVAGEVVGLVQVARSLAQQDRALEMLRSTLLIGSSIATVIAVGIGWVLAGAALRPIDRITQTAHSIGAERDFGRRISHTGPQDEVGRLATTINGMLAALQEAYRQQAQALQAQRRFVADASHELRTPLTTIRGNIGLLQRVPPISADDREAVLDDMVDETERMSRLVNDLLVLARADAGRPLRREPVALKPLIDDVCRNAKALDPHGRVRCENVADLAVLGDHDAVKQVLLILLDNAIKFTPSNGTITITACAEQHSAAITVRDTGPGIAPDVLPHIFERFFRGDTSRTGSGAGLGLSIGHALMQGQNGTLDVASEVGRGSTFTMRLALAGEGVYEAAEVAAAPLRA